MYGSRIQSGSGEFDSPLQYMNGFIQIACMVCTTSDRNSQPRVYLLEYTPNANMADHSVVARDELHDSEVSQSLMSCFGYASPENSCFVVDLFCLISLCLRVAVFLNATRRDRNIPPFSYKGKCRINTIC